MKGTSLSPVKFWKSPALILLGLSFLTGCGPGPTESSFIQEGQAVGEEIGKVLNVSHPGIRVLVMSRPGRSEIPLSSSEQALIDGLKKSLNASLSVADLQPNASQIAGIASQAKSLNIPEKELKEFRKHWYKDYSQWYNLGNLKTFMEAHRGEADLILCMPGFPGDLNLDNFPESDGLPALGAMNLTSNQAIKLLSNGKGWIYQAVRPTESIPPKPGLEITDVGGHSVLLYPSGTGI